LRGTVSDADNIGVYFFNSSGSNNLVFNVSRSKTLPNPVPVTVLLDCLKSVVRGNFPSSLNVIGEVSSLSATTSGYCYFTLKEKNETTKKEAQLSAVAWSNVTRHLPFQLKNGMQVVCSGEVDVYAPQGKCQLVVRAIEPVGVGAYELAKKQIEMKLRGEGLFSPERKRSIPKAISRVGVVTSRTGAAFRDFLNILGRRNRRIDVVVAHARVQGEGSAQDVVNALQMLNELKDQLGLDVAVLIRGGGSVEDLWTFNEEMVVRAVANSALPVITGIGHEIDTSICDLAADLRALTPSDAAVQLTREDDESLGKQLNVFKTRMENRIEQKLNSAFERLRYYEQSRVFTRPYEVLYEKRMKRLDDLEAQLTYQIEQKISSVEKTCEILKERLAGRNPKAILSRGYSFTQRVDDMKILRSPDDVVAGQIIETTLARGKIRSVVIE
jgi:exodeoxyribonuclease VII large subunit